MKKQLLTALVACNMYAFSEEAAAPTLKESLASYLKNALCKENQTNGCLTKDEIRTIVVEAFAAESRHVSLEQSASEVITQAQPEATTQEVNAPALTAVIEAAPALTAPAEAAPVVNAPVASATEATPVVATAVVETK